MLFWCDFTLTLELQNRGRRASTAANRRHNPTGPDSKLLRIVPLRRRRGLPFRHGPLLQQQAAQARALPPPAVRSTSPALDTTRFFPPSKTRPRAVRPMAPSALKPRERLPKERFSAHFSALKSQAYQDPSASRALPYHDPAADKGEAAIVGVRTISWNPLSSLVATGSSDRTVRVWNPDKPLVRFSTELKGHAAPIARVAFNPAKDAELCSVSADGVAKFWDVRTKACTNEVKDLGDVHTLAWAPDGDSLIVGSKDNKLSVLERTQSTPVAVKSQPTRTNDLAFCWSGNKVFAATSDGRTRILSFPDLEPVFRVNYPVDSGESAEFSLKGHSAECLSVALSPTGRTLATGGTDAVIALWDTTKWTCQRTITTMAGPVRSLSFSWDGNYVTGGSTEGAEVEVTQTESGEHVHTFKTAQAVPVLAWAPTRYFLAYAELGSLRIVGVDTDRKY